MRMRGCSVSVTSELTTGMAPRSLFPKKLSASSSIMSFLPPDLVSRYEPSSPKVLARDPRTATSSMADAFLWSEAFISRTSQPISRASAWAEVVLPTPGGPIRTAVRTSGTPDSHVFAHILSDLTAAGLPTTPSSVCGRYFSVQSLISPPACTPGASRPWPSRSTP